MGHGPRHAILKLQNRTNPSRRSISVRKRSSRAPMTAWPVTAMIGARAAEGRECRLNMRAAKPTAKGRHGRPLPVRHSGKLQ